MMVGQLDLTTLPPPLTELELSIERSEEIYCVVFFLSILFALKFSNRNCVACCSQMGQTRHWNRTVDEP